MTTIKELNLAELKAELLENGRKQFDMLQSNCSETVKMTDSELSERVQYEREMFGKSDAESIRANARYVQDKLDRQGRESYAQEYAREQAANYRN